MAAYLHINNKEVYKKGRIDSNKVYIDDKKYKIISFEIATGDFIVEEEQGNEFGLVQEMT